MFLNGGAKGSREKVRQLTKSFSQKASGISLRRKECDRPLVEGHKAVTAKPSSFIGHDTIREIPARFAHRQTCVHSRPVDFNIGCTQQGADRRGDVVWLEAVNPK